MRQSEQHEKLPLLNGLLSSSYQPQQCHIQAAPAVVGPWDAPSPSDATQTCHFSPQDPCYSPPHLQQPALYPHAGLAPAAQPQQQAGWSGQMQRQPQQIPNSCGSHHTRSISNVELCSSFDSLNLNRSGPASCPGPRQLQRNGTGSTDAASVGSGPFYYPPLLTQPSPQQQQQQQGQQQLGFANYPSLDSSSSINSRSGSQQWPSGGSGSSSLSARMLSWGSSGSGRYPSIPGHTSNALGSSDSSASEQTTMARTDRCNALQLQQSQPQQQQMSPQDGMRQRQRQQQQHWQPSKGLYPVISGAECPAQQEPAQHEPAQQTTQVPWGYDLHVKLQRLSGLPAVGHPYVMVLTHLDGHDEQYRTEPRWNTQAVEYGEDDAFHIGNVQQDIILRCEVWDKSLTSSDIMLGRATWCLDAHQQDVEEMAPLVSPCGSSSAHSDADTAARDQDSSQGCPQGIAPAVVVLDLTHPTSSSKPAGQLQLQVLLQPSQQEGRPRMLGPVRFRQHLCPTANVLTGHWSEADMCYSTYKLFLVQIGTVFKDVRMPWNREYDKAQAIFETPLLSIVRAQHSGMYATQTGQTRVGVLRSADDFFRLFNYGRRVDEERFFTYTLCSDSFRCSETGAAVFTDMFSKHAMHAGGAEEVLYAGEFCIMPDDRAVSGCKLILDNNSGTYSPHKAKLPLLKELFSVNFPDMWVEVYDRTHPKLQFYQSRCPSRAVPVPAAPVPAAAAAMQRGRGQQFLVG